MTPTVIIPSCDAGRDPKYCRNSTAWPLLPVITESFSSRRLPVVTVFRRNSDAWSVTQARAAAAASAARISVASHPPYRIIEAGVPNRFHDTLAPSRWTAARCAALGAVRP